MAVSDQNVVRTGAGYLGRIIPNGLPQVVQFSTRLTLEGMAGKTRLNVIAPIFRNTDSGPKMASVTEIQPTIWIARQFIVSIVVRGSGRPLVG